MTLNIPKDLYERMKDHPEIKWTEVARQSFEEYLANLEDEVNSNELANQLRRDIVNTIRSLSDEDVRKMNDEMVRLEWERMKSSTQTC